MTERTEREKLNDLALELFGSRPRPGRPQEDDFPRAGRSLSLWLRNDANAFREEWDTQRRVRGDRPSFPTLLMRLIRESAEFQAWWAEVDDAMKAELARSWRG